MTLHWYARRAVRTVGGPVLVAVMLLSACTRDPEPPAEGTGSSAAPSSPPSASATSTLSAEEQAAADAALEAYKGMWSVAVEAMVDPTQDWYAAYRQFVGDPVLTVRISELAAYAQAGVVGEGEPKLSPTIKSVGLTQPATVVIADCVDVSDWTFVKKATGESVDDPNQPPKYRYEATIQRYDDGTWLVNDAKPLLEQLC